MKPCFDEKFLKDVHLDALPEEVKSALLNDWEGELYKRAAFRMKVGMPGSKLHELVYFDKIVEAVFEELKAELLKDKYELQDYFTTG